MKYICMFLVSYNEPYIRCVVISLSHSFTFVWIVGPLARTFIPLWHPLSSTMFSIPHDPQHQQINGAVALVESPLTGLLTCSLMTVTPLHCPCAIEPLLALRYCRCCYWWVFFGLARGAGEYLEVIAPPHGLAWDWHCLAASKCHWRTNGYQIVMQNRS